MRSSGLLLLVTVLSCAPRARSAEPAPPPEASIQAVAGDAGPAVVVDDAAPPMVPAEPLRSEVICRLFMGCDGGPECVEHRACASCFQYRPETAEDAARHHDECAALFLLQACVSRGTGHGQATYERVARECEKVYRTPSKWPSP